VSKEFVERWYSRIPEMEKDLPIILLDNKVYTPREIYEEVVKGTELGDKLQMKLEMMYRKATSAHTFGYEDIREIRQVAYERVKRIIENLPKDFSIASFSGRIVSGKKIFDAIGKKAVEYEMERVIKLLRGD